MLDSLVSMLSYDAVDYLNSGRKLTRRGTAHAHLVPWQAFRASDGYVVVAVRDEKFWRNLCAAVGRPDLKDDARTRDNAARLANRDFVVTTLAAILATRSKAEWLRILDDYDIPNAAVNDIEDVFSDEQVKSRGMVQTYTHATAGEIRFPPTPIKFSDWENPIAPAPMLGEHTAAVLSERLGLDETAIRELARAGVVGLYPREA
jgi:crotonobetainyl-CoA:carnitine CoA-transferase CaiB-like acyl-CoA transferase